MFGLVDVILVRIEPVVSYHDSRRCTLVLRNRRIPAHQQDLSLRGIGIGRRVEVYDVGCCQKIERILGRAAQHGVFLLIQAIVFGWAHLISSAAAFLRLQGGHPCCVKSVVSMVGILE